MAPKSKGGGSKRLGSLAVSSAQHWSTASCHHPARGRHRVILGFSSSPAEAGVRFRDCGGRSASPCPVHLFPGWKSLSCCHFRPTLCRQMQRTMPAPGDALSSLPTRVPAPTPTCPWAAVPPQSSLTHRGPVQAHTGPRSPRTFTTVPAPRGLLWSLPLCAVALPSVRSTVWPHGSPRSGAAALAESGPTEALKSKCPVGRNHGKRSS